MPKKSLYSLTKKVARISNFERDQMFTIFSKYYENVSRDVFEKDLDEKDSAFLLYDRESKKLRGFSTIMKLECQQATGKKIKGLFSGDTIIEKEYWGQGALGIAFLKYLFFQKLKSPLQPLYWFLISKGFKTYLLMANNFGTHWPRYEKEMPKNLKRVIDGFAGELYGEAYRSDLGLLKFQLEDNKDSLKYGVAGITEQMKRDNPRIAFFDSVNPNWSQGDELCCLAEMTLLMPFKYQMKVVLKQMKKIKISIQGKISALVNGVVNID